jgi:hypothetical protein
MQKGGVFHGLMRLKKIYLAKWNLYDTDFHGFVDFTSP